MKIDENDLGFTNDERQKFSTKIPDGSGAIIRLSILLQPGQNAMVLLSYARYDFAAVKLSSRENGWDVQLPDERLVTMYFLPKTSDKVSPMKQQFTLHHATYIKQHSATSYFVALSVPCRVR